MPESADPPGVPPRHPVVVACGALASELRTVLGANGLTDHVTVTYLPANLHNRPERIAPAVAEALGQHTEDRVVVGYADCGTGGQLDQVIAAHANAQRLPGAHCYEVFAGPATFTGLHDAEPGTFYLTDFLAKHFDALVWQGLGLDEHPELLAAYFGNYRRIVLLSQREDPHVIELAQAAATRLGLAFEHHHTGFDGLEAAVVVPLSISRRREDA